MTVPEFLDAARHVQVRCHLVDGELVAMAPASRIHGGIQSRTATVLTNHLDRVQSPCTVVGAPGVVPHVRARNNMRVPDLAVVCPGPGDADSVEGPPTLVIEILSPTNASDTWANVWAYTTIPDVQEILVLASDEVSADLLRRQADGSWPMEPDHISDGTIELASIRYSGALAAFYPRQIKRG